MSMSMARSVEEQPIQSVTVGDSGPSAARSLVLVAGSGRSGTSLFTGILQRLGFYVPQPEVPADETNPRGFAESRWVVDFHTRLLEKAQVQVADARPAAWARTANAELEENVRLQLHGWLEEQFAEADDIVIKDPRLPWFLPLWQRCAEGLGVPPRVVTVLRHPATVVDSKLRWYGGWEGGVDRAAGWLNVTLFTERATREVPRVFVRYDDLLDDWTRTVAHVGQALDLSVVRDAPASSMRETYAFVDRTLSRSHATWDDFKVPESLRTRADEVWELMSRLADAGGRDDESVWEALDAARAAYVALYEESEAIARSSIAAARRRAAARPGPTGRGAEQSPVVRMSRRIPKRVRHMVPLRWRKKIAGGRDARSGAPRP
jgi:hypothetical protein